MGAKKFVEPATSIMFGSKVGKYAGQMFGPDAGKKAFKRQKKLLREQIPLMVEGAVAAGLHPLAALGVNPASAPGGVEVGGDSGFEGILGQNISRAVDAALTPEDKIAARSALLSLEQQQVNIDLTKAQLAGAQKALLTSGATPGVASPIPATKNSAGVAMPGYNEALQPHYGEGADIVTFPWLVYDVLSQKGNMLDPSLRRFPYDWSWLGEMGSNVKDYFSDWMVDYRS